ncbi:50S ribosomal protein L15 [candidate division Kazan bacterium]|uniref:Large ribosomal subunit protein uL15 n=1 Tax=candidate division Kazan bacterium TaxID=2202143 RepID=A0A420ZE84_UNCK3|nr:MAG: 50S ribosomal protein L15 [candidate division Kazan bacterium]
MIKNKPRKRVGRGSGSGSGNTTGRGTDGQKSRSGGNIPAHFEGGQMPLFRRIGKKKGFKPHRRVSIVRINLKDLPRYSADGKLMIKDLIKTGKIRSDSKIKILGEGEVKQAYTVQTHFISAKALEAIKAAGGKVQII